MANKSVTVLQSGTNNYLSPAEAFNGVATDTVISGVIGAVGNTSGVAPATGGFSVNAQGSPNMTVAVSAGTAYVYATPTSGTAQTVRVKSDASENVTIAANATGSTRYDFVYIKVDADKMNNPSATGLDAVTLTTQRSTTQESDSNGALANGLLIAVVTVANGASSISNSNISDTRPPIGGSNWHFANETWTYSSADSPTFVVTAPTDATGKYTPGMRVRLWQAGWKYFIITAVSATTITLYGGTDYTLTNAGISNPMYSARKTPIGFNADPAKWSVTTTDTSARVQSSPVNGTVYNPGSISVTIPIGVWRLYAEASVDISAASGTGDAAWGLSTANNSFSSNILKEYVVAQIRTSRKIHLEDSITLAAKTTYYLVYGAISGIWTDIVLRNNQATCVVKAVCAYL